MNFFLKQILSPTRCEKPIEIHLTKNLTIVGKKCQSILDQFSQIARFHASFQKTEDNSLFVKNLNSVNDLYINDVKVETPRKPLQIGDVIGFGVTSAEKDVGFVCTLCCDNPYEIKPEVVDITEDEKSQNNSNLVKSPTSHAVSEHKVSSDHQTFKAISAENPSTLVIHEHSTSYKGTTRVDPLNIETDCSQSTLNKTEAESPQCKNLNNYSAVKSSTDKTLKTYFENVVKKIEDLQNKNIVSQNNLLEFSQPEKKIKRPKTLLLDNTYSLSENSTTSCDPNISKNVNTNIAIKLKKDPADKNADFITSIQNYVANSEKILLRKDLFSKKIDHETYANRDATNATSKFCDNFTEESNINSDTDIICLESDDENMPTEKSNSQKRKYPLSSDDESLASKFSPLKKRLTNDKEHVHNNFSSNGKKNHKTSTNVKINQDSYIKTRKSFIQSTNQNSMESFKLKSRLIKDILQFNTKWLIEQDYISHPPPFISSGVAKLPLRYKSFDSYVSSFYPMLMLEIWEKIYNASKKVLQTQKHSKEFFFTIVSYTVKIDIIELKCEIVVKEKDSFIPCEDSIVIIKTNERRLNGHHRVFGYIFKLKSESLNLNDRNLLNWKSTVGLTNAEHWSFHISIRKREMSFPLNILMKGNGLCCLQKELNLVDALSCLKNSPLVTDILKPKWETFFVKYSAVPSKSEFNSKQMEVIECVTSEIIKSKREPKIILLQGPAATGKTHTIIGLIQKFLTAKNFNPDYKILVAAPSNAAIDEIGCRLIDSNEELESNAIIKFVRVGMLKEMHPKTKPYGLEREDDSSQPECKLFEKELQNLTSESTALFQEAFSNESYNRQEYFEDKCKHTSDNQTENSDDKNWKYNILKGSHVILSTLNACGLPLLLDTFKPNSGAQFSFCIIDDSTQCTELEILQPLMLNIRKLILVGDYKQLPTNVSSKTACENGFKKSTFERFHAYFQVYHKKTPVFTLSEQFRMHSGICKFPSKIIYDQKLVTNSSTDEQCNKFPFKPYMVLDIQANQENNDPSKVACDETLVILSICSMLLDYTVDSVTSVGIITLNKAQRALYLEKLNINPQYKNIEVDTVNNFQGREKDIIIISTVKENDQSDETDFLGCKETLSVVLTRARKCLIICACFDSLKKCPVWPELILDAKERNVCFAVTCPKDMSTIFNHMRKNTKV